MKVVAGDLNQQNIFINKMILHYTKVEHNMQYNTILRAQSF